MCCIGEQKKQLVDCAFFFFLELWKRKGKAEGKGRGRERERETAEVKAEKVLVAANFGKKVMRVSHTLSDLVSSEGVY